MATTGALRCPRCGKEVVNATDALFHAIRKDGRPLCEPPRTRRPIWKRYAR